MEFRPRSILTPGQARRVAWYWYGAAAVFWLASVVMAYLGVGGVPEAPMGLCFLLAYGRGRYLDGWAAGFRAELP